VNSFDEAASGFVQRRLDSVTVLVGQALDDLEAKRVDIESALRILANAAWVEGHREGRGAHEHEPSD
jgi:hypothetical protein